MVSRVLIAAGLVCITAREAHAFPGECLLVVNGRSYLNGTCNITMEADGSFSIGTGERHRSRHFAMVQIDSSDGRARGYWNGVAAASHAHDDLGTLVRQGGCWVNKVAKVCAWRPGTRPSQ